MHARLAPGSAALGWGGRIAGAGMCLCLSGITATNQLKIVYCIYFLIIGSLHTLFIELGVHIHNLYII